ncbi:MAG TPA: hypothetical protein VFE53_02880 [Mucilaginibacter sp.]|nr:hypothetical protein [Mucilaginibacter sp.]
MKTLFKTTAVISILLCILSCKKAGLTNTPSGAVNITNSMADGSTLNLNNDNQTIYNASNAIMELRAGSNPVNLYVAATSSSPALTYYNQPLNAVNMGNYSLFLTGASSSQVDAILIKETFTSYADSVCGVRFINLSPGSNPVSVDIQGNPNGSEVSSLAYKAYNSFKQYSSKRTNLSSGYTFEIRDAASGTLITTYTLKPVTFQNITLALTGLASGTPGIQQVNNYTGGNTVF